MAAAGETLSDDRELELANLLRTHELDWEVQTGDWFLASGEQRIVLRSEEQEAGTVLYDKSDTQYAKSDVTWVPHLTNCRQWLMERGWELQMSPRSDDRFEAHAVRRETGYTVTKVEPTERASAYSVVLEVLDLLHFGWG